MNIEKFPLADYLADLHKLNIDFKADEDLDKMVIDHVSYTSKDIQQGSLFLCKGNRFKRDYLVDAIEKGAAAYVSEKNYGVDIPAVIVSDMRRTVPAFAARYFNFPQDRLTILSITGTKGKSTTTVILENIFEEHVKETGLGPVGVISSMKNYDGKEEIITNMTTPEPMELFGILRRCVANGVSTVIIESSSQALKYHRLDGIRSNFSGMLNISEDHISPLEHADFEDYYSSKLKIYDHSKHGIVNLDADLADRTLDYAGTRTDLTTISLRKDADYRITGLEASAEGTSFDIVYPDGNQHAYRTNLLGAFNAENILMAVAIADRLGVSPQAIQRGLVHIQTPGRMEFYSSKDKMVVFLVDFAHNKLSTEVVLADMRQAMPDYYQIPIFGSVGNRSENRRTGLGEAAGKNADYVILTSDNPDFESLDAINREIGEIIDRYNCPWEQVEERPKAAERALELAIENVRKGIKTLVFLLGKGTETTERYFGKEVEIPTDIVLAKEMVARYDKMVEETKAN